MEPTTSIKFFWNGIKLNGNSQLIKCSYSLDNHRDVVEPCVTIMAERYGAVLPKDIFTVNNDTDSYTDYHDTDNATITASHPLYPYARAAALTAEIRSNRKLLESRRRLAENAPPYSREFYRKEAEQTAARLERYEGELAALGHIGHPTVGDLKAVAAMNLTSQNAQVEAKKAEEQKQHEHYLQLRSEGREFIESTMRDYPVRSNQIQVIIYWSEYPGFLHWSYTNLALSPAAAETIFKHFDSTVAAGTGYYKTDFSVVTSSIQYKGQYDIGPKEGGLLNHLRTFGEWNAAHGNPETASEILNLAAEMEKEIKAAAPAPVEHSSPTKQHIGLTPVQIADFERRIQEARTTPAVQQLQDKTI